MQKTISNSGTWVTSIGFEHLFHDGDGDYVNCVRNRKGYGTYSACLHGTSHGGHQRYRHPVSADTELEDYQNRVYCSGSPIGSLAVSWLDLMFTP